MNLKVLPSQYEWKIVSLNSVELLCVTDPSTGRDIINLVLPSSCVAELNDDEKKFLLNVYISGYMNGHTDGTVEKVAQIRNALGL